MPTKAHIKARQSLGYLMQHLTDAPWYKVWVWEHWDSYESNLAFVDAVKEGLDLTPEEMWLSQLSVHTFIENYLIGLEDIDIWDTSQVTRVEVIDQNGRQYTNYNCFTVNPCLQDNRKTLKIFLSNKTNDNETLKSK